MSRTNVLTNSEEPDGRISEAFNVLEEHMDSKFGQMDARFDRIEARLDRMEYQFNRLQSKMEVILEAITGLGDLPEDETE